MLLRTSLLLLLSLTLAVFAFPAPPDDFDYSLDQNEFPPEDSFYPPEGAYDDFPPLDDFEEDFDDLEDFPIADGGDDPFGPPDDYVEPPSDEFAPPPFDGFEEDLGEYEDFPVIDGGDDPFGPTDNYEELPRDFFESLDDDFAPPSDDTGLPPDDFLGPPEEFDDVVEPQFDSLPWKVSLTASQQNHAATVDPISVYLLLNNKKDQTKREVAFPKGIHQGQTRKSVEFQWTGNAEAVPSHFCLRKKGTDGLRVSFVAIHWGNKTFKGYWDKDPTAGLLVKDPKAWHCIKVKEVTKNKSH